jgi:Fe-S cluster assembly protein SufD
LAWNTAFKSGGVAFGVRAGRQIALPLHLDLRLVGEAAMATPRHLVYVGAGASLTLIETVCGTGGHHLNSACEIVLEDGARLTHLVINIAGRAALHVATRGVTLGAGAHYASFTLDEAIDFAREQSFVRFAGAGATLSLSGATLATARQHSDTTLVVSHDVPRCTSREMFRYALDGEARGVFQGKIVVKPHAQKTDGQMKADALMLCEGPEFDAKPELEIFADDVVCAHGATAGEIDEDLLFYLKARGLPEPQARALMVQAFIGQAVETIEDEVLRSIIEERVSHWLMQHG